MAALLKTTQIQEPSASLVNLTLSTAGGVTVAQNLTVTGTTTLSGGLASSGLTLSGSSSGTTVLSASAAASGTATLPAGTGTVAVQGVSSNIVTGTAVTPTSGTTASLASSIPLWVKRITIQFYNVQMATATSSLVVQLGTSGGFVTTGYNSTSSYEASTPTAGFQSATNGMQFGTMTNNTQILFGTYFLHTIGGNIWVGSGTNGITVNTLASSNSGFLALGGVLTQLQMSTAAGTGTFSAGTFNILYE